MANGQPDPLLEWNSLNKSNAENAIISAMHMNLLAHSPRIDQFSTWVFAGTGVTAALMVTNISNILPHLGGPGFRICGALLAMSAVFGFAAKIRATVAQMGYDNNKSILIDLKPILDHHSEEEGKIQAIAKQRNLPLDTAIDLDRVLREFVKPVPNWVGWMMFRHLRKHEGDPQVGYILPVKAFIWQATHATFQALLFIAFFIVALSVVEIQY